ncbi:hypothetical protein, partial [Vibrio parahaemolyticus]|uniref:hypothetical protein n=1 Tax=Vibrio parahaemolyticus TaxID=670 RepID=UPI002362EC39
MEVAVLSLSELRKSAASIVIKLITQLCFILDIVVPRVNKQKKMSNIIGSDLRKLIKKKAITQ